MRRTEIARSQDPELTATLATKLCERDVFRRLDGALAEQLLRLGALVELETGDFLIREGEPATAEIYLLLDGALAVQSHGTFIARLDRPGEVIGEVAVVMGSKRTADVVAEGAARAVALPAAMMAQPEYAEVATAIRAAMLRDDWAQYEVHVG